MNYWETVAGQELLNLIKMEVSRYSARKQYTIETKLQNSEETLEKELAEGAKYVSSYQYKLRNIDYIVFILENKLSKKGSEKSGLFFIAFAFKHTIDKGR